MTEVFQLPTIGKASAADNPFAQFDLEDNPFPASGLETGVLYTGHMGKQVETINGWINAVVASGNKSINPLAISGSLGAGKTHLLSTLERGLRENKKTPVVRRPLTEEGMTRIVLANLILRHTPLSEHEVTDGLGEEPATRLIEEIVKALRNSKLRLDTLKSGSPLSSPLQVLQQSEELDPNGVLWLSRWLRRENTTPAQRAKIRLSGVLESEGTAIRAIGDLLRLARAAGIVDVWFVMIDQLEELWREGVITPSRRARFLTDVRLLIDQAYEGAPIAVLLAWNTFASLQSDVSQQIQRDYLALWQRLGEPVDLPTLAESNVWPFAEKYLEHLGVTADAKKQGKKRLYELLKKETPLILNSLREEESEKEFAPRQVLRKWREAASKIAGDARA